MNDWNDWDDWNDWNGDFLLFSDLIFELMFQPSSCKLQFGWLEWLALLVLMEIEAVQACVRCFNLFMAIPTISRDPKWYSKHIVG